MSAAERTDSPPAPRPEGTTALRAFAERSRTLDLDAQMVECVDLLQSPESVLADLELSLDDVRRRAAEPDRIARRVEVVSTEEVDERAFFYPARELFVRGDGCSFTCLATEVDFRTRAPGGSPAAAPEDAKAADAPDPPAAPRPGDGIDYAAVTCEARPLPVLGFTQQAEDESAYPILLHALSSLIELTLPKRFEALDRDVYRGMLGPAPVFDLAIVLWDDDSGHDPRRPLCELARDLAELMKRGLRENPRFPPVLNDIVCLRMNNLRFDGRLRYVWRV